MVNGRELRVGATQSMDVRTRLEAERGKFLPGALPIGKTLSWIGTPGTVNLRHRVQPDNFLIVQFSTIEWSDCISGL